MRVNAETSRSNYRKQINLCVKALSKIKKDIYKGLDINKKINNKLL